MEKWKWKQPITCFVFPFTFFPSLISFYPFFQRPFRTDKKKKKLKQRITVLVVSLSILSFNSFFLLLFFPGVPNLQRKKISNENSWLLFLCIPSPIFSSFSSFFLLLFFSRRPYRTKIWVWRRKCWWCRRHQTLV